MRRQTVVGLGVTVAALALAGLGAAQDAAKPTPPAAPSSVPVPVPAPAATAAPVAPPPVTTIPPNTPAAKALANAITPEEGAAPPKAEETDKPKLAAEPPPKTPAEPMKRPRYASAILQVVDKITAETLRFESKVGQPTQFKGLVMTVRACEATAPDETAPDNVAYLDVQSQPQTAPGHAPAQARQVFRGWMFASAPTLHPFEHPIYDLWLIACKTDAPVTPPAAGPVAAPKTRSSAPKSPSTAKADASRT